MAENIGIDLKVDESLIENILLCDPVTRRGRKKLDALGLLGKYGPKEYFDPVYGLWTKPIDQMHMEEIWQIDPTDPTPYQPEAIIYRDIKKRREKLEECFKGIPGAHFAALMGVVGSGKSLEIQREIFVNTQHQFLPYRHDEYDGDPLKTVPATPNAILIDLEAGIESVTFGETYACPDHDSPLWLFCTMLLDTLIYYIRYLYRAHTNNLVSVKETLEKNFISEDEQIYAIDEKTLELFDVISRWAKEKIEKQNRPEAEKVGTVTIKEVFKKILALLESRPREFAAQRSISLEAAKNDAQLLVQLLYLVAFCAFPSEQKAIIIDNIEDYIAIGRNTEAGTDVDNRLIALSNMQLKMIYDVLRSAQSTINDNFMVDAINRLNTNITPSLSIVMVMRRTTYDLLDGIFIGNDEARIDDIFDITGDTQIADIWDRKKRILWDGEGGSVYGGLRDKCSNKDVSPYIEFADFILRDSIHYTSLQQRMARIFAHGLRRVGHNESGIIFEAYSLLCAKPTEKKEDRKYISLEQYERIKDKIEASRFMFRRAFIEYYYQQQFLKTKSIGDVGERWRNLNVGHLNGTRKKTYYGRNGKPMESGELLEFSKVVYADSDSVHNPQWRSLLHRILCILEKYPARGISACITPTYETISLYTLMSNLFSGLYRQPTEQEYGRLAEVLLAASKPERDGDYAPYVLMRIDPSPDGVYYSKAGSVAKLLEIIWKASWEGSAEDGPFNRLRYGVRLSEAGKEFLQVWQPSFSFFAALYCCNQPPIYFIKEKTLIIHLLNKVYDYAKKVKDAYATEAGRYLILTKQVNEKEIKDEKQLVKREVQNDRGREISYWTFRKQVRNLHKAYINLYEKYIENCYSEMGISLQEKEEIISAAREVRARYDRFEWREREEVQGNPEAEEAVIACF